MATAHARRKTGRALVSKSHPGQEKRSRRKRVLKIQRRFTRANYAQARQNTAPCVIYIEGVGSYSKVFEGKTATINPQYTKWFGRMQVPLLEYFQVISDLNKVSFERTILSALMTMGYELEILEVEFDRPGRAEWGRCFWYKDHPSYAEAPEGVERKYANLLRPMFATTNAGFQRGSVLSTQMVAAALIGEGVILLHKTLIFRKVILTPPKQSSEAKEPTKQAA
ncbi:MAG TPA: hypothetical protein VHD38_03620 [Candidatus Paceibacterota bacterium]|nr:hypothetical protein [Candidatus Paceibacterota bacterium]